MYKKTRSEKGITLIALVITIVILIILSVVAINATFGESGLISQAEKAVEYQANAEASDSKILSDAEDYIEGILNKDSGNDEENTDEEQEEKQQETINSITALDEENKVYYMEYTADYKFDEFLSQGGAKTQTEINQFVSTNLLDGQEIDYVADDNVFCSTFSAKNDQGQVLFGRNLDMINEMPLLITKVIPTNGDYKSISISGLGMFTDFKNGVSGTVSDETKKQLLLAPYVPLEGMNEKGLSIAGLALNYKYPEIETGKVKLTLHPAMRLVLDKAANVNEAISILQQYDISFEGFSISGHFQIADAEGNSVVVEWVDGSLVTIEPDENKSFQACTNFYLSPEMNESYTPAGQDRYDTIYNTLDGTNGVISEINAMGLLQAVSQGSATQWSALYNTTTLTIYVIPNAKYEEQYLIQLNL